MVDDALPGTAAGARPARIVASTPGPLATLPPGHSSQDCADCPQMVTIPAGRFAMGAAPVEEEREHLAHPFRNRSQPPRDISVQRFAAGKFEVTRAQYRAFATATGRAGGGCFVWTSAEFELDPGKDWRNSAYAQDDTHPVACVSWDDASAYARWLSANRKNLNGTQP